MLPDVDALAPRVQGLRIPALVVAGTADPAGLESGRRLAAALPHARLAELAGAGHPVNLTRPDEFNHILEEFLEELPIERDPGAA